MIEKRVEFENNKSELLRGILRVPDEAGKFPALIICHTFHDNKDHEFMRAMWDFLSREGFICLRFDFAGHGESQGSFRDMTITQDVKDLKAAFEFIRNLEQADKKKIGIIGHSMGAMDAIIFSADSKEVRSLAVLSTRSDVNEFIESYFTKFQQEQWKKRGYMQLYNFDEISSEFLKDSETYDLMDYIKRLKCPILIVHGNADERVPIEDAKEIFNHAKAEKSLELIENADHHFTDPASRQEMLEILRDWFSRTLK